MSDDVWKRHGADDDGFGAPLFGEDSVDDLSFGDETADPMPHWTAPPTGEVPATLASAPADGTDDVDVWSSFSGSAPVWSGGDDGGCGAPRARYGRGREEGAPAHRVCARRRGGRPVVRGGDDIRRVGAAC